MATITVVGTVTSVFWNNMAAEITEFYTNKNGEQKQRRYKAWFEDPHTLSQGQNVSVSGQLSVALELWKEKDGTPKMDNTGKQGQSIVISINSATYAAAPTKAPEPLEDIPF